MDPDRTDVIVFADVSIALRLWAKVNKNGPIPSHAPDLGPCWTWTGATRNGGYGSIKIRGRRHCTHRVAWTMERGAIPGDMNVLHKCDNPPCVNPEHLFLGTDADNVHDMVAKGRQARGDTHSSRTKPEAVPRGDRHGSRLHPETRPRGDAHPARRRPDYLKRGDEHHARARPEVMARGERHGNAKLTQAIVDEMRALRATGASYVELAARVGIDPSHARNICTGRAWRAIS